MRPRSLSPLLLFLAAGCWSHHWTWRNVPSVQSYGWLEGTWDGKSEDAEVEQYWSRPAGGTMLGTFREIRKGETTESSFLRFEQRPEGLFLVAMPHGQPSNEYRLVQGSTNELVFESSSLPGERLLYLRDADGTLLVRSESEVGGKPVVRAAKLERRD